ncbi:MAG: dTDP-glucose 4,6-dehydratase [Candidatus Berkiella sp.]
MKQILITGGAGFIGSNAVNYFLNKYPNYTIINLDSMTYAASPLNMLAFKDNPRHIFIKGDITDKTLVEKIFVDYDINSVIHFAAESHVDNSITNPYAFINTNIVGTFTLLEVAKKYWVGNKKDNRFHHISTDEVYGSLGENGYFTETTPFAPNSPYSASKASSDHLVRSFFKTYGLNTLITNCSNNYGPHQHDEKLIPTIIRKALSRQPIPIYGNGQNVRDWLYVGDHCHAIDNVFHGAVAGEHYNIGGDNELSNIALATLICQQLNQQVNNAFDFTSLISFVTDRPGHDFRYAVSIEKIKADLKWQPKTLFTDGLSETINFYTQKYHQIQIAQTEV